MCAVQLLSPYQSCRIISRTESRKDTDSSPVHAVLPEQKEAFLRMIKETEIQEMLRAIRTAVQTIADRGRDKHSQHVCHPH